MKGKRRMAEAIILTAKISVGFTKEIILKYTTCITPHQIEAEIEYKTPVFTKFSFFIKKKRDILFKFGLDDSMDYFVVKKIFNSLLELLTTIPMFIIVLVFIFGIGFALKRMSHQENLQYKALEKKYKKVIESRKNKKG